MSPAEAQEAVAAVRGLLPAWVVWGNDLFFVATALLLSVPTTWLAARIAISPLRASNPDSWVERARLAYPARRVLLVAGLLFPLLIVCWAFCGQSPFSPIPRPLLGLATALLDAILIIAIRRRVEKDISSEPVKLGESLRNIAAFFTVFIPHIVVALIVLGAMPDQFNGRAFILLAMTGGLAFLLCAGGNLYLGRILRLVGPASPRLREIVVRAAARTGVHYRGVYVVNWAGVNALAFPLVNCLAFTRRATERLADDELEAIAAHELGHLGESTATHLVRLAMAVAVAVYVPAIRPLGNSWGVTALAVSFVVLVLLLWSFIRFALRLERRADVAAAAGESTSGAYARALETIYRINLSPAVTGSGLQCHPELYDRLVAAGAAPEYARPARPSRRRMLFAIAILALPLLIGLGLFDFAVNSLVIEADRSETRQQLILALHLSDSVDAWAFHNLGWRRVEAKEYDSSIPYLKAAVALDPNGWQYPLNLGNVLSFLNRCDDARSQVLEAQRRLAADRGANPRDNDAVKDAFRGIDECVERTHPKPAFAAADRR